MTALGKLVWDHIEPGFETAIRNTYVDAVGMDPSQVPADLISREYRKLQLLLTEDLGFEFRGLLTRIVQDNIAAGLDYASYLIGYGIYSGYLMTALNETMPADDPQAEQKRRFLLRQTHQEASLAIGTFIADLEEKASRRRDALAESCERTVVSRISALGTAMGAVDEIAHFVLEKAEGSGARAQDAMASVETVASQAETVAAATQELSSAARDLAVQVQTASTSSSVVTTESEKAEDTVRALVMEASRIDEVVQLIRSIAEQTRMLALNATIEAARAGAAGRGFSVVAGEVKELARRTSEATDRIADQVQAIQKSADGAHDSFRSVRTEMARLNEVTASIASLGEEQSATTNEIARSTSESAESVRVLKERVDNLAGFGKMTLEYSQKVSQRVDEARQAQSDLQSSIFAFLSEVRSDGTEAGSAPADDRPSAHLS